MTDRERLNDIANTARAALEVFEQWSKPTHAMRRSALRTLNSILETADPTLPALSDKGWDRVMADIDNVERLPAPIEAAVIHAADTMGWTGGAR